MGDPHPNGGRAGASARALLVRFGRFWWEFLVGDTPELFVGVALVVGAAVLLGLDHSQRTAIALALPVLVVGVLVWSLARVRRGPG